MDKVLIVLEVPAINEIYEVKIPGSITIQELTELLGRSVEELSNKFYKSSNKEVLCLKEAKLLLNRNALVNQCNIRNGDHLVMI